PIAVHSRNATAEAIEVVRQYPGLRGVFHCFGGTLEEAEALIGLGFYLGIGGVLTFRNSGLDKVVAVTGLDRLVLETDAPYLAPVPFRGKRNEPSYLRHVAEKLAEVTGKSLPEVAEATTRNACDLFRL
ncbi:MAG: TatD family deoxyribonuclease, partial [Chitinophagaceae bacterium]